MIEWLNDNSGAVQAIAVVVLIIVTAVYAAAARRQADANVRMAEDSRKMAEEAREQRLDLDRPYLLIEVLGLEQIEWQQVKVAEDAEPDPCAAYPKAVACRIYNAGRGPAKEIMVTLLQPLVTFETQKKDVLEPGGCWDTRVEAAPLVGRLREMRTGEQPLGIEGWMKIHGIDSRCYGDPYGCGLMVGCTDIHDRRWATYSKFTLILTEVSTMGKRVTERTLVPVEHRIVSLEGAAR